MEREWGGGGWVRTRNFLTFKTDITLYTHHCQTINEMEFSVRGIMNAEKVSGDSKGFQRIKTRFAGVLKHFLTLRWVVYLFIRLVYSEVPSRNEYLCSEKTNGSFSLKCTNCVVEKFALCFTSSHLMYFFMHFEFFNSPTLAR